MLDALARSGDPDRAGVRPEVVRALAVLAAGTTVHGAATEVGYGRRHLGELVRRECGLTAREVHRVGRFSRSRAALVAQAGSGGRVSLARAAAEAGFADQSHLTREWHALAGCAPSTWLREELAYVQDTGPVVAAGSAP